MREAMRIYIEANQPCTAKQIAAALGITRTSVYEHHKRKALHIEGYTVGGNGTAEALYVLGKGRDAKRPPAKTQAERGKAYWERHHATILARRPSKRMLTLGVWKGLV